MHDVDQDFLINPTAYARSMKLLAFLERRLGLNLRVHTNPAHFEEGHIFLFNHFARFETVVPPYLIYKYTGKYCRAIAHHTLFKAHPRLDNFLRQHGALSSKMSGLLPFMAAEILRGRKALIFPEGGMVKDRSVLGRKGNYRVFSPEREAHKDVHRGAAALAFTLDMFKQRIRYVFAEKQQARIDHWCQALRLTEEQLYAAAQEPTRVVPGAMTFYPLRADDNLISRLGDKLAGGLPAAALEELIVEGNILLRETDMDIRTSEPISLDGGRWGVLQQFLLNRFFEQVHSLEDLFALRDNATGALENLLAHFMQQATGRIRDAYTAAIYPLTTIHIDHLASVLLQWLAKQGMKKVTKADFGQALFAAIQALLTCDKCYLHRHLTQPDHWSELRQGTWQPLTKFFQRCAQAELLKIAGESLHLDDDALLGKYQFHQIRLENPVQVYANEVKPVAAVAEAVKTGWASLGQSVEQKIALEFSAEVQAQRLLSEYFAQPHYAAINDQQTATLSGAPAWYPGQGKAARTGVLLVHGFMGRPAQLAALAGLLQQQGYTVLNMRLPGHGTSPWDLHGRTWRAWQAAVADNYQLLATVCDQVHMVGFSTGGALAMLHGATQPEKLASIVGIGVPLVLKSRGLALVPWMNRLNKIAARMPGQGRRKGGVYPFYATQSNHPELEYQHIPVAALHEVLKVTRELKRVVSGITAPVQLIQADADPVVNPKSAAQLAAQIPQAGVKMVPSDIHSLVYLDIGETLQYIETFIQEHTV